MVTLNSVLDGVLKVGSLSGLAALGWSIYREVRDRRREERARLGVEAKLFENAQFVVLRYRPEAPVHQLEARVRLRGPPGARIVTTTMLDAQGRSIVSPLHSISIDTVEFHLTLQHQDGPPTLTGGFVVGSVVPDARISFTCWIHFAGAVKPLLATKVSVRALF